MNKFVAQFFDGLAWGIGFALGIYIMMLIIPIPA